MMVRVDVMRRRTQNVQQSKIASATERKAGDNFEACEDIVHFCSALLCKYNLYFTMLSWETWHCIMYSFTTSLCFTNLFYVHKLISVSPNIIRTDSLLRKAKPETMRTIHTSSEISVFWQGVPRLCRHFQKKGHFHITSCSCCYSHNAFAVHYSRYVLYKRTFSYRTFRLISCP